MGRFGRFSPWPPVPSGTERALGGLRWRETSALLSARGSSAEIFAYNCMMSACERCRLWTRSLDTLHSLQAAPGAPKPDVVTFTSAVGACEWREVLGLLMRMDQL
ncbi:unnamed protein product, partial [Effrenium voratum]